MRKVNYKTSYVVLFLSVLLIGLFIWVRVGVDDNIKYVSEKVVRLIGCERDLGDQKSHNMLVVQSLRASEASKLMFSVNKEAICNIDFDSVQTFDLAFYKKILISLKVNGRVILSEESGIASYKRGNTFFIVGIILFNLVGFLLIYVAKTIRNI